MMLMKVMRVLWLSLLTVLVPTASLAQEKPVPAPRVLTKEDIKRIRESTERKRPAGGSFYIAPIDEQPNRFSFLLSDENNRTLADSFSLSQMQIFAAVMGEAKKFANSNEGAGTKDVPSITRFVDKKESSFIVDVEKAGIQSRYYITLDCLTGRITVNAGAIKRDGKEHETLFSKLLTRLEALQATPPKQYQ